MRQQLLKLSLLIWLSVIGILHQTNAQAFITTWKGSSYTIPTNSASGTYNYNVTWTNLDDPGVGDGSATGQTGDYTITGVVSSNTYRVEITGTFPHFYLNANSDAFELRSIEQWGSIAWTSMESAFSNATFMDYNATDVPDLSGVTNVSAMFRDCSSLSGNFGSWDVSTITDMSFMFYDLSGSFGGDITGWDVSNVTDMSYMLGADLPGTANPFNQDISGWDVSNVTNMEHMFFKSSFNQDISSWNVSKVTNMNNMFNRASSFNQSLADWDVSMVANMTDMFTDSGLGIKNYDATLKGWSALTLQSNVILDASVTSYCTSTTERQSIITNFTWTINDAGLSCPTTTWDGATWSSANPTEDDEAIINGAYDVATNGNITCGNLIINTGQTLTMTSGTIHVACDFDNNGNAFIQTGGTVTFNGSTSQTIEGSNTFKNITINNANGVLLNQTTNVTGVLTLTSGNLVSGGNLRLKSTSAGAGGTATVNFNGGSVAGNVVQERFLDGATQSGWRYIAPAVFGQTIASINDDVTLNHLGSVFSPGTNVNTYVRTHSSPFPNIFHYDQSLVMSGTISAGSMTGQPFDDTEIGWEIPSATSDALSRGSAVALHIGSSDVTLDFTGVLQSTDVVLSLAHGGQTNSGWHLIGNPFTATLDWNAVYEDGDNSGVDPTAYLFDATSTYSGTYASFNAVTDAGVNGGTKNIASGQGFFIQTTSGMTGDVTLKTSHTLSSDVQFNKTTNTTDWEGELRLKLADKQGNEDELLLYFVEGAHAAKDFGDATKFFGTAYGLPELASKAFDTPLLMDCRKPFGLDDEIQSFNLAIKSGQKGLYTLKAATIAQFDVDTDIFLEDLQENILINLHEVPEYTFTMKEDETFEENRFQVHVKVNRVTSIEDDLAARGLALFAHKQQVHIQFSNIESAKSQIIIYDLMGKLIHQQSNQHQLEINIPIQQRGIYLVKIKNSNGVTTKRIIIQ